MLKPQQKELFGRWDDVTEREKRSRTMFAQESIKVEDVAKELHAVRSAIGSGVDVARFVPEALRGHGAVIVDRGKYLHFDLAELKRPLKEQLGNITRFDARFEMPVPDKILYLNRTHPIVESLAGYVLTTTLDPLLQGIARRCGVIRTRRVGKRTTLLLVRFRYYIISGKNGSEKQLLAEDCRILGFSGAPDSAEWIKPEAVEELLTAEPDMNVGIEQASQFVSRVAEGIEHLKPAIDKEAFVRGDELLEAHRRVRTAARIRGVRYRIEPHLPPDVLGIYVYLPVA
jgi:hypothetical protein